MPSSVTPLMRIGASLAVDVAGRAWLGGDSRSCGQSELLPLLLGCVE